MKSATVKKTEPADVCLVLEGTYPYVQGGVSSWVHQVINGLPDLKFAIFHIGSTSDPKPSRRYTVPANVTAFEEMFLFDAPSGPPVEAKTTPPAQLAGFYAALRDFTSPCSPEERVTRFWKLFDAFLPVRDRMNFANLCRDEAAWEILTEACERTDRDRSFADFYWNIRSIALQLWRLVKHVDRVPHAKVYHCCSTGYAGLVGAALSRMRGAPLLLTEHGIYTKERIIEIFNSRFIIDSEPEIFTPEHNAGSLRAIWIAIFDMLSRIAYEDAGVILTLFEGNAKLQREFGAPPGKIVVLPNGIRPEDFDTIRAKRDARLAGGAPKRPVVGFVGRIVPIKDVKTLIRAAAVVVQKNPEVMFHLVGPQDEDPDYVRECHALIGSLGLDKQVILTGPKKLHDFLHEVDIMVLTSVSEGQPLTILEAYAAGIPCVVSNVGSCAELINGRAGVDTLGRGGRVTGVGAPRQTADALLDILATPGGLVDIGRVGLARVKRFYRWGDILDRYRAYYTDGVSCPLVAHAATKET